jgi:hypothetical protein
MATSVFNQGEIEVRIGPNARSSNQLHHSDLFDGMHQPPKRLASGRPVKQSSAADGELSPCIPLHHPITEGSTFKLAALLHSDQRQEPESAYLLPLGPTPCAKSIIVAN